MSGAILIAMIWLVIPAALSSLPWVMAGRLPARVRFATSLLLGPAFPALFGCTIFLNEGGKDDPDPWTFLLLSIALGSLVSICTASFLAWQAGRR